MAKRLGRILKRNELHPRVARRDTALLNIGRVEADASVAAQGA
jgi:hypothetical protein